MHMLVIGQYGTYQNVFCQRNHCVFSCSKIITLIFEYSPRFLVVIFSNLLSLRIADSNACAYTLIAIVLSLLHSNPASTDFFQVRSNISLP